MHKYGTGMPSSFINQLFELLSANSLQELNKLNWSVFGDERKILKLQRADTEKEYWRNRKSPLEHQSNNGCRQDPVIDTEISGQSFEKSIYDSLYLEVSRVFKFIETENGMVVARK